MFSVVPEPGCSFRKPLLYPSELQALVGILSDLASDFFRCAVVTQSEKKHALSVPENTGRRDLYKTVFYWWQLIL
jgi:hypothetical protein